MLVFLTVVSSGAVGACSDEEPFVVADFDGNCDGLRGPGAVVGVELETGAVVWDRTVGDATGVASTEGVVAGTGQSGAAFGVEVATGDLLWCEDFGRVDQEGNIVTPGFAASSGVLATSVAGGGVVGVEPGSGRELWRASLGVSEGLLVEARDDRFVISGAGAGDSLPVALDPASGSEVTAAPPDIGPGELMVRFNSPYLENRQEVDVAVERGGRELWSARLPGFVVSLHGDVVVIIDQTGGTGVPEGRADTRVSGYDSSTGELVWQVPLPGTPQLVADAGPIVVIPSGTVLYALDVRTGEIVWERDGGSPGRGGRYSESGSFQFLEVDEDAPGTLVGLVVAEEPYRD